MITSINTQIDKVITQISSGRKEQTPLERMREIDAMFEQSRVEHSKYLSEQLEIRISQEADVLQMIDSNLSRVRELMIDNNSYSPGNAGLVNTELQQLRDGLVHLMNTKNVQGELMFAFDRQQFDGNDNLIDEFTTGQSINNAIGVIDKFIADKDLSLIEEMASAQDQILVDLTKVGLRMQHLDRAQEVANNKLLRYEEIRDLNSSADLTELATQLNSLRVQQEAMYKATAITSQMSLFNYI